jgi:hypothetical protein
MKAIQIKARAIISIITVPNILPVAERAELIHGTTFSHH